MADENMDGDLGVMTNTEPVKDNITETEPVKESTQKTSSDNVDIGKSMQNVSSTEMVDDRGRATRVETTSPKTGEDQTQKPKEKTKLSDFDKIIGDTTGIEKLTEKKVEVKKEDEKVTTTQLPTSAKQETDLSGFGEQQQVWLRRMPAEAREHFAKKLREEREHKETIASLNEKIKNITTGKEILPESYFEHPKAYELTEEYQTNIKHTNTARSIYNHWYQQKIKAEAGEDWEGLEDEIDDKGQLTGNILKLDPAKATPEAKTFIDDQLSMARQQVVSFQAKVQNIAESFKVNHEKTIGNIKDLAKKYYPQFEDKNYEGNKTLEQVYQELPKVGITKTNPIFDLLAKSVTLNYIYVNYIKNNLSKVKTQEEVKKETMKAGPTSGSFSGGSSSNTTNEKKKVSLSDFNKLLG